MPGVFQKFEDMQTNAYNLNVSNYSNNGVKGISYVDRQPANEESFVTIIYNQEKEVFEKKTWKGALGIAEGEEIVAHVFLPPNGLLVQIGGNKLKLLKLDPTTHVISTMKNPKDQTLTIGPDDAEVIPRISQMADGSIFYQYHNAKQAETEAFWQVGNMKSSGKFKAGNSPFKTTKLDMFEAS